MKPVRYIQFMLIPMFVGLSACNENQDVPENTVEKINEFLGVEKPIQYDEASSTEISEHIEECQGKSGKVCVHICHKPPGNPENDHSKTLSLKASLAHVGHGDTLGDCDDVVPEPEPEPTPSTDPDLPAWCLENIDIDADCDGYTDDGNHPLY